VDVAIIDGSRNVMAKERQSKANLTQAETDHFEGLLLEKRRELLGNVKSMEDETLKRERTDLSNLPLHMGDMGTDTYETDNALTLVDGERRILEEIDQALDRIENGTYGICLGSGKPISKARLQAIPWTKYSIEYATKMEKGQPQVGRTQSQEEPAEFPDEDAA
jgi:RNA polymerase-binding protein DksA